MRMSNIIAFVIGIAVSLLLFVLFIKSILIDSPVEAKAMFLFLIFLSSIIVYKAHKELKDDE